MSGPHTAPSRRVLLLCLHNHQPEGNFDFVLEEAARNSYRPFLETLASFPSIKVTIHFSGWLLQWIADRAPETYAVLRELAGRGQLELLGGGMYEPILALLPERDHEHRRAGAGGGRGAARIGRPRAHGRPRSQHRAHRTCIRRGTRRRSTGTPGRCVAPEERHRHAHGAPADDGHGVRAGLSERPLTTRTKKAPQ